MAVHDLDLARFLVGEVEEVHAWASVLFDERFAKADDWDTSVIMLKFRNGALGVVETARHSEWGYDIRTEVAGADGQGRRRRRAEDPGDHLPRRSAGRATCTRASRTASRSRTAASSRSSSRTWAPVARSSPGPDDAYETLRLAVACTRSWRENRPVRLDEVTA